MWPKQRLSIKTQDWAIADIHSALGLTSCERIDNRKSEGRCQGWVNQQLQLLAWEAGQTLKTLTVPVTRPQRALHLKLMLLQAYYAVFYTEFFDMSNQNFYSLYLYIFFTFMQLKSFSQSSNLRSCVGFGQSDIRPQLFSFHENCSGELLYNLRLF